MLRVTRPYCKYDTNTPSILRSFYQPTAMAKHCWLGLVSRARPAFRQHYHTVCIFVKELLMPKNNLLSKW